MLFILFVTSFVLTNAQGLSSNINYNVIYSWRDTLPVAWDDKVFQSRVPSRRVPIGIKALDEKLIINIPRWANRHHPINIAWLPRVNDPSPSRVIENATVQPFPNWEMQKIGNCRSFQYVQSFEIEPQTGILWMPDSGLKGINCPSKITLLNGRNGQIIHQYSFPRNIAKPSSNFLNDIAIDVSNSNDKFAFISDSKEGKVIVYSLLKDKSWTVEHQSMKVDLRATTFDFLVPSRNRRQIIRDNNINGIAISPALTGSKTLYYRPLVSYDLYSMPTDLLKNENATKRINNSDITKVSDKIQTGQGDGMVVDENGYLYTAEITRNTIIRWDLRNRIPEVLLQDNETLIWGDTFAIDEDGFLWLTTRGWPVDSHNRIVRLKIDAKSYLNQQ